MHRLLFMVVSWLVLRLNTKVGRVVGKVPRTERVGEGEPEELRIRTRQ